MTRRGNAPAQAPVSEGSKKADVAGDAPDLARALTDAEVAELDSYGALSAREAIPARAFDLWEREILWGTVTARPGAFDGLLAGAQVTIGTVDPGMTFQSLDEPEFETGGCTCSTSPKPPCWYCEGGWRGDVTFRRPE